MDRSSIAKTVFKLKKLAFIHAKSLIRNKQNKNIDDITIQIIKTNNFSKNEESTKKVKYIQVL